MGDDMKRVGKYWVIFYSPLPESGERVALALVIEEGNGQVTLEYDPTFSKVAKFYPDTDLPGLSFSLDRLRAELRDSAAIELTLNAYGPQLEASAPKRIGLPLLESTVDVLMTRYILPARRGGKVKRGLDPVAKEIEAFVRNNAAADVQIEANVAPRDILGIAVAGAKRVAMGIRGDSGWTLIDGIDLNHLSPTAAVHRADDISRSFWNYNRAAQLRGVSIRSVGVVHNGSSHLDAKAHEAHDYALHRFEADSDLAIDAASNNFRQRLTSLLNSR